MRQSDWTKEDSGVRQVGLGYDQLVELVEAGMTVAEIAVSVNRCHTTVRRWLARHGLQTTRGASESKQQQGRAAGLVTLKLNCRRHGETEFVIDRAGAYRCRRCRVESVMRRRRKVKEVLVQEAGGSCLICGYGRYLGALQFHHVDPAQKRLGLAVGGMTLSLETMRAEARKCVLLCSNCHAEVEGGVVVLPLE
jgi:hypothetical protein